MDVIVSNLLAHDSIVVQRATAELTEAFKRPDAIPALCQLAISSDQPPIRQYAAVLLRKNLGKLRNWQLVPPEQQQAIKNGMLNAIVNETEKSVRNAIAQFVGVLLNHESSKKGTWMNDVLKFIFDYCSSSDAQKSELGSSVFEILTDTAPDQFLSHMEPVCEMFSAAMVATEATGNMATPVIFNILLGMSHLVPFILGHNGAETTYQKSIPYVVKALGNFAQHKPEDFVRAFDILEGMADFTPKLLTPHVKLLVEFTLNLTDNSELENSIRVRSVQYIGWLVRLKKKSILKNKLLEPIIKVVFSLMGHPSDDDEGDDDSDDEDYYTGNDKANPRTTATQTMDLLALHIPPEKLIPPLLQLIEPALQSADPNHKRAAYLTLAVLAEGCSEAICSKYLQLMLNCVKIGIIDANPSVSNAALFALGQFSEHLQPDISKYAEEILPILFQYLHKVCYELKSGIPVKHVDRMFYALETYCENLDDALIPYLPVLMERLLEALSPENTVHIRELSFSCISSAAKAAKTHMLPYFPNIMEKIQMYLVRSENEDIIELRPGAIDTLASIAHNIGKENFMHLTQTTMTIALDLLDDASEPELRTSLYNLFAALAAVLNADMAPVMPKIINRMLESVKSTDDITPEIKEDDGVAVFNKNDENEEADDIDIEDTDEEDDDDDYVGFNVENAFLDEKEEAILALKQVAEYTGLAFAPYIQQCFENIYKLVDHPNEDIRKSSLEALTQFILSLSQSSDDLTVQNAILILVPKAAELIKTDEDYHVVMTALDSYGILLKQLKNKVLFNEDLKATIFTCVYDVLCSKVSCQTSDEVGEDEEREDSEYDEALIQVAGDVLPKLGGALSPDEFAGYFQKIISLLGDKIAKSKSGEDDNEGQRSVAYGVLSECFQPLGRHTGTWFETLLPAYLHGLQDSCNEVRHNCVFGIGELVLHSGEVAFSKFPMILQTLSTAVSQEEHPGTLDNICGALARLIMANSKLIPLEQVLPVFVKNLPLREDFDENLTIFKSFQILWSQQNEALLLVLNEVITIGLHVLHKKEYKEDETRAVIMNLLQEIRNRFSDRFNQVVNSDPAMANFVQTL